VDRYVSDRARHASGTQAVPSADKLALQARTDSCLVWCRTSHSVQNAGSQTWQLRT